MSRETPEMIPPRPSHMPWSGFPDVSLGAIAVSVDNLRARMKGARKAGLLEQHLPELFEDAVILIGGLAQYIRKQEQTNPPGEE